MLIRAMKKPSSKERKVRSWCCLSGSMDSLLFWIYSEPQFFENLNPLNGFKDDEELTTYLYNQSCKIEPREGGVFKGKPKYHPDALKSPGVKIPTKATTKPHSNSLKSPKSPSALSVPPTSSSPDDSHFGIVDITPGQLPKYIGDSGRINQGFSADTPLQTPTGIIRRTPSGSAGRRMPLSPPTASADGNHFSFPPQLKMNTMSSSVSSPSTSVFPTTLAPGAIVLNKPPAGRRKPPPVPPNGTLTRKPPPPIPCEPSSSNSGTSSRPGSPPKDSLTETIKLNKTSSPPKSPSVSLMVPLPKDQRSPELSPNLDLFPATCPPRPPKPSASASRASTEEPTSSPPPLPPKTYRKGNASTVNGNPSP